MAEIITVPSSNTSAAADREFSTLDDWLEYFKFKRGRDSPSEARNALLVIATLITTATYQAVLSPPGGLWQETTKTEGGVKGHEAGKSILGTNDFTYTFGIFLLTNAIGFFGSLFMIHILTQNFPLKLELRGTMLALLASYVCAMISILPPGEFITLLFTIIASLMPLLIVFVSEMVRKFRICSRPC